MPKIADEHPYGGVRAKIKRLGLEPLVSEVRAIITDFELLVEEQVDANGAAALRKMSMPVFEPSGAGHKGSPDPPTG